ncbi:MAG: RnfABCDGE type electron transport complex subunit D [Thermoanaerobaculia bacterium]|nr:RnfABCDGE type electron transport complex subunit D [Thermoanaerobaculia bacterium]
MTDRLVVTASPHLKGPASTPVIMWNVVGSLVPIIIAAAWYFGVSALLVIAAATLGAVGTEAAFGRPRAIVDGSAAITGLLLGLTLPAGLPLWMAFVGGAFGIGLGKIVFGGLGYNVFNPALLGRAFLMAAFPQALTTWPQSGGSFFQLRGDNFALPFMAAKVDAITEATPLGLMKFEGASTELSSLMIGSTSGSAGETAGLLILLCGGYLALRRFLDWRIPASIFITVAALSGAIRLIKPDAPGPLFMLFSGGLMLGAVYMATDLVTSPITHRGRWVFGFGIGVLVVVIRLWGGLPEAVMYAILLMNALVPFINKATQPRVFGTGRSTAATAARAASASGGAK